MKTLMFIRQYLRLGTARSRLNRERSAGRPGPQHVRSRADGATKFLWFAASWVLRAGTALTPALTCALLCSLGVQAAQRPSPGITLENFKLVGELTNGQANFVLTAVARVDESKGGSVEL